MSGCPRVDDPDFVPDGQLLHHRRRVLGARLLSGNPLEPRYAGIQEQRRGRMDRARMWSIQRTEFKKKK